MAAVVAYYLSEVAPPDERRPEVATEDLEKYFKQAGHPLPGVPCLACWPEKPGLRPCPLFPSYLAPCRHAAGRRHRGSPGQQFLSPGGTAGVPMAHGVWSQVVEAISSQLRPSLAPSPGRSNLIVSPSLRAAIAVAAAGSPETAPAHREQPEQGGDHSSLCTGRKWRDHFPSCSWCQSEHGTRPRADMTSVISWRA